VLAVKVGIAAGRPILRPHAEDVADVVVRLAVIVDTVVAAAEAAVVDAADREERAERKLVTAMAGRTHEVVRGRTNTRRDTRITIGNEDTTKRWPRREGQVVEEVIKYFVALVY
jgi:hypothetical protein